MRADRSAETIAVVSGKGGVGKSNISLNLSILLSAAGRRVALVDADIGTANLDVLLNVEARATLAHAISGSRRLEEIVMDLPCGVQFVPGASGLSQMANLSEFQRAQMVSELAALEADNDVIVIDCGAGIGRDVTHLAAQADNVLAVTTPEPTAVTDAYALIKVLAQHPQAPAKVSLLVNQAEDRHEARATYQRVAEVARQFLSLRVLDAGCVLADPKVSESVRRRQPFVLNAPRCPASRCLAALANKLSAGSSLVGQKQGFFRRVANWFA